MRMFSRREHGMASLDLQTSKPAPTAYSTVVEPVPGNFTITVWKKDGGQENFEQVEDFRISDTYILLQITKETEIGFSMANIEKWHANRRNFD